MRRLAIVLTLLLVSACTITVVTPWLGEAIAQSTATTTREKTVMIETTPTLTRERTITIESTPAPGMLVPQPPPPPRAEVQVPPPTSTYVWAPGYWTWNNGWVWIPGRWELPPERMVTWVPGQWAQLGHTWVWRPGHWE